MKSIVVLLILFCLYQGKDVRGQGGCPRGFSNFADTNRCYVISYTVSTFELAKKTCERFNSLLAPVLTCDEQVDLRAVLAAQSGRCRGDMNCMKFWIDVYKTDNGNTWKSASVDIASRYQYWAEGFPQGNGSCAFMSFQNSISRGTWRNDDCNKQLKYVCITCPKGFEYLPESNECIYLNVVKNKWNYARVACTKLWPSAQMVTINDERKMAAVARFLDSKFRPPGGAEFQGCILKGWTVDRQRNMAWTVGLAKDLGQCGSPFVWLPLDFEAKNFTYTNWSPGNPNCLGNREFCVRIVDGDTYTSKWDDAPCDQAICSICEFQ